MLVGGHEDKFQFEAVLVFLSSQAPLMGSFTLLVLEKYLRGGPQVSSHLRLDVELQISKVKWHEFHPKLNAECAFKIPGLRSTGKT